MNNTVLLTARGVLPAVFLVPVLVLAGGRGWKDPVLVLAGGGRGVPCPVLARAWGQGGWLPCPGPGWRQDRVPCSGPSWGVGGTLVLVLARVPSSPPPQ